MLPRVRIVRFIVKRGRFTPRASFFLKLGHYLDSLPSIYRGRLCLNSDAEADRFPPWLISKPWVLALGRTRMIAIMPPSSWSRMWLHERMTEDASTIVIDPGSQFLSFSLFMRLLVEILIIAAVIYVGWNKPYNEYVARAKSTHNVQTRWSRRELTKTRGFLCEEIPGQAVNLGQRRFWPGLSVVSPAPLKANQLSATDFSLIQSSSQAACRAHPPHVLCGQTTTG